VGKSGTSNLACERSLQSADLIFQVLSLLAESTFGRLRSYRLDCIADAHDFAFQLIAHDREILRECAIIVDQENISKPFRRVATDILRNNLTADRTPDVIDTVLTTNVFRVIQGYGTVTICDYEDVFRRKYLLRSYKRRSNDVGGFVLLEVSTSYTRRLFGSRSRLMAAYVCTYTWYE
jgi:hypothetical protein